MRITEYPQWLVTKNEFVSDFFKNLNCAKDYKELDKNEFVCEYSPLIYKFCNDFLRPNGKTNNHQLNVYMNCIKLCELYNFAYDKQIISINNIRTYGYDYLNYIEESDRLAFTIDDYIVHHYIDLKDASLINVLIKDNFDNTYYNLNLAYGFTKLPILDD